MGDLIKFEDYENRARTKVLARSLRGRFILALTGKPQFLIKGVLSTLWRLLKKFAALSYWKQVGIFGVGFVGATFIGPCAIALFDVLTFGIFLSNLSNVLVSILAYGLVASASIFFVYSLIRLLRFLAR
jgi:hypothetical protein